MLALKHKVFQIEFRRRLYWSVAAALQNYDREFDQIRGLAEDFAAEIGAENVVSVVEQIQPRFSVVVWYREEQGAKPRAARSDEFFETPSYR